MRAQISEMNTFSRGDGYTCRDQHKMQIQQKLNTSNLKNEI